MCDHAPRTVARAITLNINGECHDVLVKPRHTLLEAVRELVGLTGTKDGCEQGTCGACTVLLDGRPVLSCLTLAVESDGCDVRTVEGLATQGTLTGLQQAFLDHGAVQCGYCTPGILMAATALLARNAQPSREEINEALEGNLCRCTGYNAIVAAVQQASGQRRPDWPPGVDSEERR